MPPLINREGKNPKTVLEELKMKKNRKENAITMKDLNRILVWPVIMAADILVCSFALPALADIIGDFLVILPGMILGALFPACAIGFIISLRSFIQDFYMNDKAGFAYSALSLASLITLANSNFGLTDNMHGFPSLMFNLSAIIAFAASSVLALKHLTVRLLKGDTKASGGHSARRVPSVIRASAAAIDCISCSPAPAPVNNNSSEISDIDKKIQKHRDNIKRGEEKNEERRRNLKNGCIGADKKGVEAAIRKTEHDIEIDRKNIAELENKKKRIMGRA